MNQQQGRDVAAGTEMNAKATFMAKLPSRRKTAASAIGRRLSCHASSVRFAGESIGVAIHSLATSAQLAADHDFLQGLGRSLVENNAHLDVIDVVDLAQTAAEAGLVRFDCESVERAKEWNPGPADQSGAMWNCARAAWRGHGHPPRWARETNCYAHI
ncbi:hypothetical protein HNQ96_002525 [Aminobacter lissarensis]|uniref:Uncharacterized protein n=1 Tax=Aminobacter carboxidus TaxID=376165 RepID=A0A8E2BEA7_9HYPH|nr:hypothetical protein [Aminobacter lissarensis]MBB6466660.1 hypothetical protein [Aminobacter lissarensis]